MFSISVSTLFGAVVLANVGLGLATSPFSPAKVFPFTSSCGSGAVSCHSNNEQDLCCIESPGGILLHTQLWDANPPVGPAKSWTIHGLWSDNCNLSHDEECDHDRDYGNISSLLEEQGESSLLNFLKTYWGELRGPSHDETFWEHEWDKHGTCLSTLRPECLPENSPKGAEVVIYFRRVEQLFQSLPSYEWLESGGIVPTNGKTYSRDDLESALSSASGVTPSLSCHGKNLASIAWYFNVRGSVIDGDFLPIDAPERGNCPSTGIKYVPKRSRNTELGAVVDQEVLFA